MVLGPYIPLIKHCVTFTCGGDKKIKCIKQIRTLDELQNNIHHKISIIFGQESQYVDVFHNYAEGI